MKKILLVVLLMLLTGCKTNLENDYFENETKDSYLDAITVIADLQQRYDDYYEEYYNVNYSFDYGSYGTEYLSEIYRYELKDYSKTSDLYFNQFLYDIVLNPLHFDIQLMSDLLELFADDYDLTEGKESESEHTSLLFQVDGDNVFISKQYNVNNANTYTTLYMSKNWIYTDLEYRFEYYSDDELIVYKNISIEDQILTATTYNTEELWYFEINEDEDLFMYWQHDEGYNMFLYQPLQNQSFTCFLCEDSIVYTKYNENKMIYTVDNSFNNLSEELIRVKYQLNEIDGWDYSLTGSALYLQGVLLGQNLDIRADGLDTLYLVKTFELPNFTNDNFQLHDLQLDVDTMSTTETIYMLHLPYEDLFDGYNIPDDFEQPYEYYVTPYFQ